MEKYKTKVFRLKLCYYALEGLLTLSNFLDKLTTYIAISRGYVECNPIAAWFINTIGLLPATIFGFIAVMMPLFMLHYGIRKYKWNTEGHWWLLVLFMVFYSTFFLNVAGNNMEKLGWIGSWL